MLKSHRLDYITILLKFEELEMGFLLFKENEDH